MSKKAVIKPLSVALGTVFSVSLANTTVTHAADNPFGMQPLSSGYTTLAEGKCGEGKCGGAKASEGKCGEGKCGSAKAAEGKCGMGRMDSDGDGKVTKDEFMQGHDAMFSKIDTNSDGAIDAMEREAHLKKMMGFMKEGKCGEGKCGGSN